MATMTILSQLHCTVSQLSIHCTGSLVPRPSFPRTRNVTRNNFYCMLRCACGGRPGNEATAQVLLVLAVPHLADHSRAVPVFNNCLKSYCNPSLKFLFLLMLNENVINLLIIIIMCYITLLCAIFSTSECQLCGDSL